MGNATHAPPAVGKKSPATSIPKVEIADFNLIMFAWLHCTTIAPLSRGAPRAGGARVTGQCHHQPAESPAMPELAELGANSSNSSAGVAGVGGVGGQLQQLQRRSCRSWWPTPATPALPELPELAADSSNSSVDGVGGVGGQLQQLQRPRNCRNWWPTPAASTERGIAGFSGQIRRCRSESLELGDNCRNQPF